MVSEDKAGSILVEYLASRFTYLGLEDWRRRIAEGQISVNGERMPAEGLLCAGDRVAFDPPAILLVHGDADPVVPITALYASVAALSDAGIHPESHVCRGLPHAIDEAGLRLGLDFLRRVLG